MGVDLPEHKLIGEIMQGPGFSGEIPEKLLKMGVDKPMSSRYTCYIIYMIAQ